MVGKGCDEYLAYVRDVSIDTPTIESVLVVRDFPDVFATDLPGYYRRFVEGFSSIATPMTRLTQKGSPFRWIEECEGSFQKLKIALATAPILRRWLEILKDYYITILYHPEKANVVADTLSRREERLGRLAYLPVAERPLTLDVQVLANQFVRFDISEPSRVLACVVFQSSLYNHIRERQYDDPHMLVLKYTVQHNDAKEVTIGDDGVLRMHDRLCVPNVDGLRELILQ
ncbi:uncharacterized protein [Nicotiana sylvestris]|uniref:uncharacterized protein n=1 Tax=Nicotiana sylvestris TaxID=4096 RepID=UPI00388CDB02